MEPWGEERADLRAAIQGARIVAALTGEPQNVDDFLPDFEPPDPATERAATLSNLQRLAMVLGAEVARDA
jgi:tRNA C32,U32 (ribose-2'-O)-methylase TrmJ